MKKITVVFDGLRLSESALQYAIFLGKKVSAHISALFLDDFTYNSYNMYQLIREGASENEVRDFDLRDRTQRGTAGRYVEAALQQAGLSCSIHHGGNIAIQDVLEDSVYSDLIIVDIHESFTQEKKLPPTRFMRDLLTDTQCPVLIIPSTYREISKAILLYDGEPSSVYAIKMAGYLLPWINRLPAEVLSINNKEAVEQLNDNRLMDEFMQTYFPAAPIKVMQGPPETVIVDQLKEQEPGTMVILGAYRRSAVSRFFRMSMADVLMSNLQLPLFIAHNK
ncbi:universal stress protein [Chitinophaga niabensis]|uniref:universal stress protein n=1 Tax=Chitinophaga niabensis TaxID=536979 RepID=UPI0031B9C158